MNPSNENSYTPADDDNQGVAQLMAQGAAADPGVAQVERMNPVMDSGPEPEKAEVNDPADGSDPGDSALNDDVLAEEETEEGRLNVDRN